MRFSGTFIGFCCAFLLFTCTAALPQQSHDELRAIEVARLNSLPGMTWTAGISERFRGKPLGHAKHLCGVKAESHQELLDLVAKGIVQTPSTVELAAISEPPDEFDSESHWPQCAAIIGDIRDQSDCGCCWAFGAASTASDRLCINSNGTIKAPLSAQDTCFCAEANGCNGGTLYTGWQYIQTAGLVTGGQYNSSEGLCSDYSLPHCHHHGPQGSDPFPAEGTTGCPKATTSPQCPTSCDKRSTRKFADDKYSFKGTVYMYNEEKAIRKAIMANGPVEAAFSVFADFENYVSGVYQHTSGISLGGHAIRIVGWGTENGTDYWKVANSWNPFWGEKGYFRIIRGDTKSMKGCGIEQQVTVSGPEAQWGKKSELQKVSPTLDTVLHAEETRETTAKNLTQYLCTGADALSWCMNDLSKCQKSTHLQGSCMKSKGGHSLKASCDTLGNVNFDIFATSTDCTGADTKIQQLADTCQQGQGGAYFVKLECN